MYVNFEGIRHSVAVAPKTSKAQKRLCACWLLEKRCTVGSWIVAVEAWTVAFVEGIKSYLSWSRLKLFDNKFYHCFSSSCSCIFNFRWSCNYIVTRARTARLNRNCLRGGYRSGTCGCLVFHWHWISFTWIICINMLLVCHYLKLQHVIRRPDMLLAVVAAPPKMCLCLTTTIL